MGMDDYMMSVQVEQNEIGVLEHLLSTENINLKDQSEGIARKIVAEKSFSNLSKKQRAVYDSYIYPQLSFECDMCNCKITELSDIQMLDENSGRCSSCQHSYRRMVLED